MELDNILNTAKDVFETAYKKTGTVVAEQKQRYEISKAEARLAKNYEALGKLCFSAIKSNGELSFVSNDVLNSKISARMSRIEELRAELLIAKNQVACANCGAENSIEAAFCATCGEKLNK